MSFIKAFSLITISMLALPASPVSAGPLEDGQVAYDHEDYATSFRLWRPLAEQGNAGAQYNIGFMYYNGDGVATDYKEAKKWLRKAADQGDTNAQYNLGVMYDNGVGVPMDLQEAEKWYRQSANVGNSKAQVNLGLMYAQGRGVKQSDVLAYMWFKIAAVSGDKRAAHELDLIDILMPRSKVAEAQKMAQEWKPQSGK